MLSPFWMDRCLSILEDLALTQRKSFGVRKCKLYRLQYQSTRALIHGSDDLYELWHRRMAHLHHGSLKVLREIVIGLLDFSTEQHGVCKGCALGKYAKTAFPSSDSRSKGILDLVHLDVWSYVNSFIKLL